MGVGGLISADEYLSTSFHPDCEFLDGAVIERNVGNRRHSYAQTHVAMWFGGRSDGSRLEPFNEIRMRIGSSVIRIPDIVVVEYPLPDEEVLTSPPYLCIEIMSPDDTISSMQDRLDDYMRFGVGDIWVIDPWKQRGWHVTVKGWAVAVDGIMRTADGRMAMPVRDVLLP